MKMQMNVININMFIILILININDSYPYNRPFDSYGRGAFAYSTEINVRCISGDSLIKLSNGEDKKLSSLQIGDEILTIDQRKLISTEMILMLDKQISSEALFYTLTTECGYEISLTEFHLIPIKCLNEDLNYLFAKQIQIGDLLFVLINNTIEYSPVINIRIQLKKGYYAPLTMKGTLLVNQILTSSFANTNNHYLAQVFMFPFRFYYKLNKFIYFNNQFTNNQSEGLHWIISILFHLVYYFIPQILILS